MAELTFKQAELTRKFILKKENYPMLVRFHELYEARAAPAELDYSLILKIMRLFVLAREGYEGAADWFIEVRQQINGEAVKRDLLPAFEAVA